MRDLATQTHRKCSVSTPLGPDAFVLTGFSGYEAVSEPFCFELNLIGHQTNIQANELLGLNITIVSEAQGQPVYTHGVIATWQRGPQLKSGQQQYRATLVPALHKLRFHTTSRIFTQLSVPEIITQVIAARCKIDLTTLHHTYPKRSYCVQYHESDFDFVHRLLAEEGIFYTFKHTQDAHVLYLGDAISSYQTSHTPLAYHTHQGLLPSVSTWRHEENLVPSEVSLHDFSFETPKNPLITSAKKGSSTIAQHHYPGRYQNIQQNKAQAQRKLEALQLPANFFYGQSGYDTLRAGMHTQLTGHESGNGHYFITRVEHHSEDTTQLNRANGTQRYQNHFKAISANTLFRPSVPQSTPKMYGVEPATVIGTAPIHTDKLGRIKVAFHWNRYQPDDINNACWVRVGQALAGNGFGSQFIPRVGSEVLIAYEDGNPDHPFVVGSLYNGKQPPAFTDPKQSGFKTQVLDADASAYHALKFDDATRETQLIANKDLNIHVDNNHTIHIKKGHHLDINGNLSHQSDQHTIEAETLQLKTPGGSIHLSPNAIYINGPQVHLNHPNYSHHFWSDLNDIGGIILGVAEDAAATPLDDVNVGEAIPMEATENIITDSDTLAEHDTPKEEHLSAEMLANKVLHHEAKQRYSTHCFEKKPSE